MAVPVRLQACLDKEGVDYSVLSHPEAFTAQGTAAAAHVSHWQMAKVLVGRDDNGFVMGVLPAACDLDLPALRGLLRRKHLELATEEELVELFPDCELGAMPPFGKLYGMPVYADRCFATDGEVLFPGGNHHEAVRVSWRDFVRAAQPVVTDFCRH